MLAQLVVSGIVQGAIYAFVALSMTVIFRSTTAVNFGQGDFFMLAAFVVYVCVALLKLPYALAVVIALATLFFAAGATEKFLIRPLVGGPHFAVAMMTIALGFVLRGVIRYIWGRDILPMPALFNFDPIIVGSVIVTGDEIVIVSAMALALLVFFLGFYGTRLGKLVQAVYQSERGARLIGVDVARFHRTMWGAGAAMAALAGVLIAPVTLLYPDMGASVLIKGFAAMTLGGFGSLGGAVVGGILLGIMEQVLGAYVSSLLIDIAGYLIIIIVLIVRPAGLFGRQRFVRV